MAKCRMCGRHGLFRFVNVRTGLCANCQKELLNPISPVPPTPSEQERSIEFPTVYIGNGFKCKLVEKFEDVELEKPDVLPNFSSIDCCDKVFFYVDNGAVIAKNLYETLGHVTDKYLVQEISKSLEQKRPIFSRILGYDDETGEIHIVIAFYKIVNYDYDQYAEASDHSLDYETVDYY